jgi:hypothetical protein
MSHPGPPTRGLQLLAGHQSRVHTQPVTAENLQGPCALADRGSSLALLHTGSSDAATALQLELRRLGVSLSEPEGPQCFTGRQRLSAEAPGLFTQSSSSLGTGPSTSNLKYCSHGGCNTCNAQPSKVHPAGPRLGAIVSRIVLVDCQWEQIEALTALGPESKRVSGKMSGSKYKSRWTRGRRERDSNSEDSEETVGKRADSESTA